MKHRMHWMLLPLSLVAGAVQAGELETALAASKVNLDLRAFYFDRDFDKPGMANAKAFNVGGVAKLETGSLQGFQVGVAYFGSFLAGLTERPEGAGTSLLKTGTNDDLSLLGEAYVKYSFDRNSIQFGRQRLATPLANDRDLRMLPTSYQGLVVRSDAVPNTHLQGGWLTASTGFTSTSESFLRNKADWGERGLAYGYVENTSVNKLKLRGQYAWAVDDRNIKISDYRYLDGRYQLTPDSFVEAQYLGNGYNVGKDSQVYGVHGASRFGWLEVGALYNRIAGNVAKTIQSGPIYADWQQGYGNYEPSEAFGMYATIRPTADLSVKIGQARVSARENSTRDDYRETMLDAIWQINKSNRLRVRYSIKDETDRAYSLNPSYPDRTDLRVIYQYTFAN